MDVETYPRMLYQLAEDGTRAWKIAADADAVSALRAEGWQSLEELTAPKPSSLPPPPPSQPRRGRSAKEPADAGSDPGSDPQ